MQVTTVTQTEAGQQFNLDNGDALLLKAYVTCSGKAMTYPVYTKPNGRTYSARTGGYAATTVQPAMAAVRRFLAVAA